MTALCTALGLCLGASADAAPDEPMTLTSSTSSVSAADFDAFLDAGDPTLPAPPAPEVGEDAAPFRAQAHFIEAIEIIGNDKTARETILSRISVKVGDLVDEEQIETSRLRLLGTGFFRKVDFSLRRGSKRGRVLLLLEVEERNTVLIDELYLGFSEVSPIFLGLGLAETNFLGRGVTVGAEFVTGRDRRAVELRTFAPSLFGTPLQLSASAIFLEGAEVLDPADIEGPQLTYRRLGGTLGVGFSVGVAQRVSLIYRLESVRADRLPNLDPAIIRQAPSIQFDDSVLSTLTARFERDTRDDPFVPTQGNRVALSVEVGTTVIGSTYEFSKYTLELSQAFLLSGDHSLELHLFGGMVQGNAPFFSQFFFSDFAYYAYRRDALPRNAQLNFSPNNDYDDLIASAGAVYSVPVSKGEDLLYQTWLYGGVEATATASLDELQEDGTGRGTGGVMPISFDVGVKLDTFIGNFTLSLAYVLNVVF